MKRFFLNRAAGRREAGIGFVILALALVLVLPRLLVMSQHGGHSGAPGVPPAIGTGVWPADVSLTDQDGRIVPPVDSAGRLRLIFFGFTFCPSICPTELSKVARVLDRLGPAAARVVPMFVTIDPERDDPAALKMYVAQFHPGLQGVTGSRADLDRMISAFGVYAKKVGAGEDYTMDHSTWLYLVSSEGRLLALYPMTQGVDQIADDLSIRLAPSVIPAKAGIQPSESVDPGLRRGDD